MFCKLFIVLSLAVVATTQWVFPQPTQGGTAMIQVPGGNDTRIFYQPASGEILQLEVSGPLDAGGHVYALPELMVRSGEVRAVTPIAAVGLGNNNTWSEIHLFFLSPALVLSHYYWTAELGVRGGPSCTECLTSLGIRVINSSYLMRVLSASADLVNNMITVLYMDSNSGGLNEAVRRNGEWLIGRLD